MEDEWQPPDPAHLDDEEIREVVAKGYSFAYELSEGDKPEVKILSVRVHDAAGATVAYTTLQTDVGSTTLNPLTIFTEEPRRNQGIGSAMYALAQRLLPGYTVRRGNVQSDDARRFWDRRDRRSGQQGQDTAD